MYVIELLSKQRQTTTRVARNSCKILMELSKAAGRYYLYKVIDFTTLLADNESLMVKWDFKEHERTYILSVCLFM